MRAVINDQAAQLHGFSMPTVRSSDHPASWTLVSPVPKFLLPGSRPRVLAVMKKRGPAGTVDGVRQSISNCELRAV
jgi:hypothetical protein